MAERTIERYDATGNLISRTSVTVTEGEIKRDTAPDRLRFAYRALRTWSEEAATVSRNYGSMTAAQRTTANALLFDRFARLCDGVADLLLMNALDDEDGQTDGLDGGR